MSPRVRDEWQRRIAAEYRSAAITQHFTLWLIQIGASPDLIGDGLRVVEDELVHAAVSNQVYREAGGDQAPNIDRAGLELTRRAQDPLERDVLRAGVRIFCLGETVAVPLFAHMRKACTAPAARDALDRILRDEVRHRAFGWALLDWMLETAFADEVAPQVERELPGMFADLERNYGEGALDELTPAPLSDQERAWGLAPPDEYAEILHATFDREYLPRFEARGIDPRPAWNQRLTLMHE